MSSFQRSFVAFATTLIVSFAVPIGGFARAQDVLLDIKGPAPYARAAYGIAIGDWDGDGIGDLAIGAPKDSSTGLELGAVRIHSGKDGSILATLQGDSDLDEFGFGLVRMPDLDGDGVDDLAVSAISADFSGNDTGSVYLYAGRTGALLRRIDGPANHFAFGDTLGLLGDVDGDGIADLFVGNYGYDDVLHVHSGADGHEIITLNGPSGEFFGATASALDDLDGDGVRELLVGARLHFNSSGIQVGGAYVLSPVTGAVLRTHEGTFSDEYLGCSTETLGDLDGDGVHDYAIAAVNDDQFYAAMVLVFSGATGAQFAKITSPTPGREKLLGTVVDAGDLNGDGVGDLAVNGNWMNTLNYTGSALFLFSGKNFLELDRIDGDAIWLEPEAFGDLNGDGLGDLIVGSVDQSFAGDVVVYSGDDLWLNATPSVALAGNVVSLNTREGAPGTLTLLALEAIDGTPTFQILGGVRQFGALGGNSQSLTVPPGLAGHDFAFRAYANGPAGKVISSVTQTLHCE